MTAVPEHSGTTEKCPVCRVANMAAFDANMAWRRAQRFAPDSPERAAARAAARAAQGALTASHAAHREAVA